MIELSIVSGTYNRLEYLKRMVASARAAIPRSIKHEFVLVDGGSVDGTLEWLREQPDVVLIEDGQLLGAISAFTRGAYQARGRYVLLANDDITFYPESIVIALSHLVRYAQCGAVAFADNRSAQGKRPGEYNVQYMPSKREDGMMYPAVYAQVGLFRKWLGDACNWWGADTGMKGARTYGGDNYLSARIWEAGFSVDAVQGAVVEDLVVDDELRRQNVDQHGKKVHPDSRCYHTAFPGGPSPGSNPLVPLHYREMKILYLPIFDPSSKIHTSTKRGLREALQKVGLVVELDYLRLARQRTDLNVALPRVASIWQPDLILLQCHDAQTVTPGILANVRRAAPSAVVVNWNGDAFKHAATPVELLEHVDLHTVVDLKAIEYYQQAGLQTPVEYWQIGIEEPPGELPEVPAHDVLFMANVREDRRRAIGEVLRSLPSVNVGLYGKGWSQPSGFTEYDFAAGEALYRKCRIAISDVYLDTEGYVSNRLLQALAAGVLLLQEFSLGLDEVTGLRDGVHYVSWNGLDDLREKVLHWLSKKRRGKNQRIAEAGQAFVWEHFSFDAQVRKLLLELLPRIRDRQLVGGEVVHARVADRRRAGSVAPGVHAH